MMQKAPESLSAEVVVGLCVEDELVPENIDGLRWHSDVPVSAAVISSEELLEP
jgi:hypothetical protein